MKVELNLALAQSPRERYALAWAVPAVALGLAGLMYIGQSAFREFRQYRDVHAKLVDYKEQEKDLRKRETALNEELGQPQYRQILREVQYVNGLIQRKQVSLTDLAARVTKLLPRDARLTGLALVPQVDQYTVRITLSAKTVDAVESFVSGLEDSPEFKDPVIANQGFDEQASPGEPVTVSCSARYTPSAVKP